MAEQLARDRKEANAHITLGIVLNNKNQLEEAIVEFRQAIAIDPKFAAAYDQLGSTLRLQGKLDEAVSNCRKAVTLQPQEANHHNSLGYAFWDQGKLNDAIAEFRQAIKMDPKFGPAVANLAKAERMVALQLKLPDVLSGKAKKRITANALTWSKCAICNTGTSPPRLYADTFIADAKLADDLMAADRYHAACFAALAAAGQGTDGDKLDDQERIRLRKQAGLAAG